MSCPTVKEVCTTCKCTVQEKTLSGGKKEESSCCPPPSCGTSQCQKDCSAVYKQLGCCIQECLMEKCREAKKKRDCC